MKVFLKVLRGILNTLITLVIIIGIAFIGAYVCGIEPYVVESGSMEPSIKTGSVCFVNTKAKYDSVKVNDVIAFKLGGNSKATHRVIDIGSDGITTKGDNNELQDEGLVTEERFVGKTIFSIPKIGIFVKIIQTTKGKVIFTTFIIVLFLAGILLGDSSKKKDKKEEIKEEFEDKKTDSKE